MMMMMMMRSFLPIPTKLPHVIKTRESETKTKTSKKWS